MTLPAILALAMVAGCGGQMDEVTDSAPAAARVNNPFAGVKGYVNPEWKTHVLAESGGDRVADTPTAIWLRSIASITAASGGTSLRQHFDNALAQGAGYVEVVLDDLPGRDCARISTNGELQPGELSRYQTQFVDPIAAIEADSKYASLRIINIIEPGALPNLVTASSGTYCANVLTSSDYVGGVQYGLGKLGAIPNAYNYLDIAHHGVLGWEANMTAAIALYAKTIQGATGGFGTVAGFVSNVANYSATVEPFFQATTTVGGTPVRQSKWVDWNGYVDEQSFDSAWRTALIGRGASTSIGMLIDTSRNGWGGSSRPTQQNTSTDVNTFVDQSRIDRRARVGNWCNQSGAGLGARPQAVDANGIQAYVWIKPPGESDGASSALIDARGIEYMCNPAYEAAPTGALPNAPVENAWFSLEFQELMANANPSPDAVTAKDTTPPSAPTNLTVTGLTYAAVSLSWNASTDDVGVAKYIVYAGSTMVATASGTTATVTGLQANTTYVLTVRAADAAGNLSGPSNALAVSGCACTDTTPPSAPANLTYSNLTSTGVTLDWTASTDNAGVARYQILDAGVVVGTTGSTQFEVSGLLPGTSHVFSVRSMDTAGNWSNPSNQVAVTTQGIAVPSAPANLRWTASGGTVELCWDAPDGWSQLDSYNLLFGSFNLGSFGETCVDLIGFKPGTPYGFTVKTVDASGNASVASNAVTVLLDIPPDTTAPTAPGNLAASTPSSTSARLTWTASKDDVGVVLYQVLANGSLILTVPSTTSATVTGLTTGKNYLFTVKAVDAAGNVSSASNGVTVVPLPYEWNEPPGPPTNVHVTGVTATSVSLAWNAGTDAVGVILYEVFAGGAIVATSVSTSVTVPNLTTGTAYTFTVKSLDAAANVSIASDPVGAMPGVGPIDPQLPAAPTNVRAVYAGLNGPLMLSWSPSTGSVPAVKYQVYSELGLSMVTTLTQVPLWGYGAGSSHTFTVRAMDAAGDRSVASASVTVTIPSRRDNSSPSDPSNLKVTATTSTSVSLSWTAATDDQGMAGYDIYTDGVLVGISLASTAIISNLTARSYTFDVRSRDLAGNVSVGSEVTVTPGTVIDPVDPTAPGNLRIAEGGMGTAVILSWDPPVSGGTVTGYEVYERYPSKDYLITRTAITSTIVSAAGGGVVPFYVKAIHGSGSASTSALVTIIFPDTGDPVPLAAITQLKATATGTTVTVTWSPITSPCSLWYEIYANSVLVGITTSASSAVPNLAAGTSYALTVNAIDSCADSSGSNGSVTVSIPK